MKKNKKIIVASIAAILSVVILSLGTFAFMTDSQTLNTTGTAGSVDILVSDLALSNQNNFNPGDEYFVGENARPGTSHLLTYNIENLGNKSVAVRSIITIGVKDQSNANLLGAEVFSLLKKELGNMNGSDDLSTLGNVNKYYLYEGSNEYVLATATPSAKVIGVRYVILESALSGFGTEMTATNGASAEKETGLATESTISYPVAFAKSVTDAYQLSNISFKIEVQALQYRNTYDGDWAEGTTDLEARYGDWNTVFSQTLLATSN